MTNPVLKAIADRRSIRGYEARQISKEELDALLDAGMQAPSARNLQPWHFTVVQNRELLTDISSDAMKNMGRADTDIFHGAPMAIFISCNETERWARHDCGIAVENIALAAHSLCLGSVILGLPEAAFKGSRGEEFAKKLKFPEGYSFAVAIAVGYPTVTKEAHKINPGLVDYAE